MDLKSVTSRTSSSGVSLITMDCADLDLDLDGRDGNGVDGLVVPGRSMVVMVMIKSR